MPTFPTYRGELPQRLNPLNPRHYWLLGYWVFFRPTALHCYLYRADPNLYQTQGWTKFQGTWRVQAYRNLYLMLPGCVLLSLLLGGLAFLIYQLGTLQGHTASVNAVAVTPNGQIAISAPAAGTLKVGTIKVWDLQHGAVLHTLQGHTAGVNDLAVSKDGLQAISASGDTTLKVWDLKQGAHLSTLKSHSRWVNAVALLPEQRAISASADGTLKIWDLKRRKVLHTLKDHTDAVNAVAVSPDGLKAISASLDNTLKVWNLEQGKLLDTLTGHTAGVNAVALTPDGQIAVSASNDNTLKVWNLQQRKLLHTLASHTGAVNTVVVTSDGIVAVSASSDNTLKVWNIKQGTLLHTLAGHSGWVNALAVTPEGQRAISASSDRSLKVWDLQTGSVLHTLKGHSDWVRAVAVTPDGELAISAAGDRIPKLWNLASGKEVQMSSAQGLLTASNWGFTVVCLLLAISALYTVGVILAISVMAFSVAGSVLFVLGIGVVGSVGFSFAKVIAQQVLTSPAFRDAYGAVSINPLHLTIGFGIAVAMTIGVAFSLVGRKALSVVGSVVFILVLGVAIAVFGASELNTAEEMTKVRLVAGLRYGQTVGVEFNKAVLLGASRAIFYPVQFLLALQWSSKLKSQNATETNLPLSQSATRHPVEWDELVVIPLPKTTQAVFCWFRRFDETSQVQYLEEGLRVAADVANNPFQRASAQRALCKYLHLTRLPLHFLYHLLASPDLNAYVVAPVSRFDWQRLPSTKQLFLGELAGKSVDCSSDWANQLADGLVWSLTWLVRDRRKTPLTRFAGMLYQLMDADTIEADSFDLAKYAQVLGALNDYPGGIEIAKSFEAFATFLAYHKLADLSAAANIEFLNWGAEDKGAIRPAVIEAIARLRQIGAEVATYQSATNPVNQLAALARATCTLDALDEYVVAEVVAPEQTILRRIIRQWRRLVSKVAGEVATMKN